MLVGISLLNFLLACDVRASGIFVSCLLNSPSLLIDLACFVEQRRESSSSLIVTLSNLPIWAGDSRHEEA